MLKTRLGGEIASLPPRAPRPRPRTRPRTRAIASLPPRAPRAHTHAHTLTAPYPRSVWRGLHSRVVGRKRRSILPGRGRIVRPGVRAGGRQWGSVPCWVRGELLCARACVRACVCVCGNVLFLQQSNHFFCLQQGNLLNLHPRCEAHEVRGPGRRCRRRRTHARTAAAMCLYALADAG